MAIRPSCFRLQRTAVFLLGLAASGVVYAGPSESPDDVKKIRDRADSAADAGNLTEAVNAWRQVWAHEPNDWELANNIGRGELRRGNYREAARWLRRCLDILPKATTPKALEREKAITLELMTARQQTAALTVDVNETDTRVVVDDDSIWVSPLREDIFVEPGEHRLQAFKGTRTAFTTISTVAGKDYRVALVLPPSLPLAEPYPFKPFVLPPPAPAPSTPESFRWWPVGVGGGFVATGVLAGLLMAGFSGSADASALSTVAEIKRDGGSCTQAPIDPRCSVYDRYASQSSAYATGAIVSFVAAGAITAGVIGYAIYENHRVSVQATVGSLSMRYNW